MKTSKNINTFLIIALMLLCSYQVGFSQKRLEVGDVFPKLVLQDVYNYKEEVLDLNDFAGMPIIIDFWSTTCKSCLESFPKLDSLQKMFAGQVQFILVNPQPFGADSTDRLFKNRSALFKPIIPFITRDTVLTKLLEPVGMPYMTWIGADGVVKHFSGRVTSNTIQQLIDDEPIGILPYVRKRAYPTSIFAPYIEPFVEYYSGITKRIHDANPKNDVRNAVLSVTHADPAYLFKMAFNEGEGRFTGLGRFALEVRDSARYIIPKDDNLTEQWRAENTFNYALALPPGKQHLKYRYMREDLERYFDVEAKVEKRKMTCYVLRSLPDAEKIATKGGELISVSTTVYDVGSTDNVRDEYVLQNLPYSRFVSAVRTLAERRLKVPFVDLTTPLDTNIDITFDGELIVHPTFDKLQEFLHKHGYAISEEEQYVDVLVLSD